ncbi:cell division protein FtsZ [Actinopolyspora saharensis]|uniref:Cell division protein FtsZ n=2 Tax=Actinopolyspora saharensis TaxID=995062 RepID=A0A1H1AS76_9ACTN|nr:cell division protein FtsZ [Actinopolyspora saharensis]SDQ42583.1 cell division protein FtsZ [Actinopolyspora saharensis]
MTMTPPHNYLAVIKVVGIGGGGVNAVNRMIEVGLKGVEFIAVNTDAQALLMSDADVKLDIGRELTRGLGAGAAPDVGYQAADDHKDEIEEVLKGADMVFVTAGEGGGTGTGGAPVIASVARKLGALTIGVVTRPFSFEGKRRASQAEQGIKDLRDECDTLIVIPNDRLLQLGDIGVSLMDAFRSADEVLLSGVQGITDLITTPGLINLDFADVKSVMSDAGSALMGIGSARGEGRAVEAAQKAINSPLLEASMEGAHGVLLAIAGGSDLGLFEINESASLVQESAHPEANIIFGTVIDDSLGDEVRVTVIAAGFDAGAPTHKKLDPDKVGSRDESEDAVVGKGQVVDGQAEPVQQQEEAPQQVSAQQQAPPQRPAGGEQAGRAEALGNERPQRPSGQEAYRPSGQDEPAQSPGESERTSVLGHARGPMPSGGDSGAAAADTERSDQQFGTGEQRSGQPGAAGPIGNDGSTISGEQQGAGAQGRPTGGHPANPAANPTANPTANSTGFGGSLLGRSHNQNDDDNDDEVDIPPFMRR